MSINRAPSSNVIHTAPQAVLAARDGGAARDRFDNDLAMNRRNIDQHKQGEDAMRHGRMPILHWGRMPV